MDRTWCIGIFFLCCISELYAQTGCVYGKVLDYGAGTRSENVSVSLIRNGYIESSLRTDENGEYSFQVIKGIKYQLKVKAINYEDVVDEFVCHVDSLRRDLLIRKPARLLRVTEVGNIEKEIDMIEVGHLDVATTYYFQFFNDGSQEVKFQIGSMRKWMVEISPSSGILKPNEMQIVSLKIDPKKFEAGNIDGKLLVMTNDGCRLIRIKAVGDYPKLTILPLESSYGEDAMPNIFKAEIEFEGQHTFDKLGYCYSYTDSLPTIDDGIVFANDMGNYAYSDLFDLRHPLPWWKNFELEACRTYYVRAFLLYRDGADTIVHYSWNEEHFTVLEVLCP